MVSVIVSLLPQNVLFDVVSACVIIIRQVQKRGDDLAMPPLLKREKGILKQLQHEQVQCS